MPKVNGWFSHAPILDWEQERVSFLYDSRPGPAYYSYPMTGLVPYNEPHEDDLLDAPAPLWIAYLDPSGPIGKIDSKGDRSFVIDLPESFESYLEQLPYKHRKELRNNLRRNADVECVENDKGGVNVLWEQHIAAIQARCIAEGETPFSDRGILLLRELFLSPVVHTLTLTVDGHIGGVNISFRKGETIFDSMFLHSDREEHRRRGLGTFAVTKNIECAIRDGFRRYDMLTGNWGYKHKFGAHPVMLKHYIKCTKAFAEIYEIPLEEVSVLLPE